MHVVSAPPPGNMTRAQTLTRFDRDSASTTRLTSTPPR
jgi:hypothetical protein